MDRVVGKVTSNFQWDVAGQRSEGNRGICIVILVIPKLVYTRLTNLDMRMKNQEKWLMLNRGLMFVSESCCNKVMALVNSASHLLNRMSGNDFGGFAGIGSLFRADLK